jgi:siroheme synthase-like protein
MPHPRLPLFLDLTGRGCVVVGAGSRARARIDDLVGAGADVTVVAPDAATRLAELARSGVLRAASRPWRPSDLAGACLAVAATGHADVDRAVQREARRRGVLVNVHDVVPLCDWIAPAAWRRGDLSVAISTEGRAPVLAGQVRRLLADELDVSVAGFVERARLFRRRLARSGLDLEERRERWRELASEQPERLPVELELPLVPPEVPADHPASCLRVLGTSALHAPHSVVARTARALEGTRPAEAAVLLDAERAEVVLLGADEARTAGWRRRIAAQSGSGLLELTGAAALAHLVALAAGGRSIVPGEPAAAESLEAESRRLGGEGLGRVLRTVLESAARPAGETEWALPGFVAGVLADRLPPAERCTVALVAGGELERAVGRALESEGLAGGELDASARGRTELVVLAGAPASPLDGEWLRASLGAGWRHAWTCDLSSATAVDPSLGRLFGGTRWDLDLVADATLPPSAPLTDRRTLSEAARAAAASLAR